MERNDEPMSVLEPGTAQRGQLRSRVADIAWTALCVVLGIWTLVGVAGIATGTANAWAYGTVGAVLFTVATWTRVSMLRERARSRM